MTCKWVIVAFPQYPGATRALWDVYEIILEEQTILYGEVVKVLPFDSLGGVLWTISNLVGERIGRGCIGDMLE